MYGEYDGSAFVTEYHKRRVEIDKLSYSQRVPGLQPDEVNAELLGVLWHAWVTFDQATGLTLGQWWWVLWTRRKRDLIEAFFAQKNMRPHEWLVPLPDAAEWEFFEEVARAMSPMVELDDLCPSTDLKERAVWRMICAGFTGVEIRRKLSLSVRRFYAIVGGWQTDDLRTLLIDAQT